jgi:hypothetical protein
MLELASAMLTHTTLLSSRLYAFRRICRGQDQRWSHDLTIIKQVESRGISSGCPVSDVSIRSDVDRVFRNRLSVRN